MIHFNDNARNSKSVLLENNYVEGVKITRHVSMRRFIHQFYATCIWKVTQNLCKRPRKSQTKKRIEKKIDMTRNITFLNTFDIALHISFTRKTFLKVCCHHLSHTRNLVSRGSHFLHVFFRNSSMPDSVA